ncbi:MAG TPA: hypothetical protein VFW34_00415 [Candidatus Rubrimentiphilum sp.]|nr:hypothetical protein [Candidatus Rubrimentiphilum sp.]
MIATVMSVVTLVTSLGTCTMIGDSFGNASAVSVMVGAVLAGDGVALGFPDCIGEGDGEGEGLAVGRGVLFLLGFGVGVGGGTLKRIWHEKSGCVAGHAKPFAASASGYVAGPGEGVAEPPLALGAAVPLLIGVAPTPMLPGGSGLPCCPELKLPEQAASAASMSAANAPLDACAVRRTTRGPSTGSG